MFNRKSRKKLVFPLVFTSQNMKTMQELNFFLQNMVFSYFKDKKILPKKVKHWWIKFTWWNHPCHRRHIHLKLIKSQTYNNIFLFWVHLTYNTNISIYLFYYFIPTTYCGHFDAPVYYNIVQVYADPFLHTRIK